MQGIVVVVDDDVTGRVVVETAAIVVVVEGAFVVDVLELVDVVVDSASGSRTTLAKKAKFPSPGVVALSARTVSASEVPAAVFAGAGERQSGRPIRSRECRPGTDPRSR